MFECLEPLIESTYGRPSEGPIFSSISISAKSVLLPLVERDEPFHVLICNFDVPSLARRHSEDYKI